VTRRRRVGALAAFALALSAVATPATAPVVRAATPDLTLVTDARYDVQPSLRRVRVMVDIVARNHLKDTVTRRFFFERAYLAVLPGTRGFRISSTLGKPTVRVVRRTRDQTLLLLTFGRRLAAGRSAAFQLRFDLPDPGGAPTRDIRIGSSLVSFPVWAFASNRTPGSTVTVSFPPGYSVRSEAGSLAAQPVGADGRTTLRSGLIRVPLRYYAFVVGDRPESYVVGYRKLDIAGTPANLEIRAWPDDPAWSRRVGGLFGRALPAMAEAIGLPWVRRDALVVQEAVSRASGGYAGLFDPAQGRVEVAYYATPFVVLHEAAHAWFNGNLLADRWANEGFASHYALQAATTLKVKATAATLTPALRRAAVPLNAWQSVGRESALADDYGYAASHALARLIAERAGADALRDVWRAAADREAPYQPGDDQPGVDQAPAAPGERVDGPPDWRGLLDLLEQRTGKPFDDLWATWVVRPEEAGLLAERRAAIADYEATARQAGDWALPRSVRQALRAWQFGQARDLLADARAVLARYRELAAAARDGGLRPPTTVEQLFEGDHGFGAAASEADAELRTVEAFTTALSARPATPDALQQLGLYGVRPEASIALASAAFERGDLVGALRDAADAQAAWLAADEIGRDRLLSGLGVVLLAGLGILWFMARLRRFRRRRARRLARSPMAHRL
jgi:hypothetical protein